MSTKITISQEGTNPISIEISDKAKSQEGILAGIGIAIAVFFILGILSAVVDYTVDTIKFKKAYKQLTDEQKQKLKEVLKETADCMLNNCKTQTDQIFKKFKSKIISDKSKLKKAGLELITNTVEYNVYERGKKDTDKINKHSLDLLNFCNAYAFCSAKAKIVETWNDDYSKYKEWSDYTEILDNYMKASNIDDEPEKINFNVKNINDNVVLKSTGNYGIFEDHIVKDKNNEVYIRYDIIFNFTVDNAKAKKEIGFFLDILKKV